MSVVRPSSDVPAPDLPRLHDRDYRVTSYRKGDDELLLRGEVMDVKPPGVYIEEDPEPLVVHHMVVDLVVHYPDLAITDATVVMETHPHDRCRSIEPHYGELVGLSIARGFTHKVRELFGGPRGCTHTTALLQAMAPVAIQSVWSMRRVSETEDAVDLTTKPTPEQLRERMAFNLNTCHVWAEDGEMFAAIDRGEDLPPPSWVLDRLERFGITPDEWRRRMNGGAR